MLTRYLLNVCNCKANVELECCKSIIIITNALGPRVAVRLRVNNSDAITETLVLNLE